MFLPKEKVKPPRSLRTARLSVVKNKISTPVMQTTLSTPNKAIKALYDYHAQSPNELSFKRGDFFLVTGREGDHYFYEAFNPITNSRGIVPIQYFQVLEKDERAMTNSRPKKGLADHNEAQHKSQPLYGVVLYDFHAQRSDELSAKTGESIIVIGKPDPEWYVAKPIERLGGPGLIPVKYVDIRDASTGRSITTSNHAPQNVDSWKKQGLGHEASSTPLGKLENQMQQMTITEEDDVYGDYFATSISSSSRHDEGSIVVSAYIDSYILEADQYWFIVFARLKNGKYRVLYRLYEDFYDFQINFLQEFPAEAGKRDQERILPYMPGPLDTVDDEITEKRAKDLSKYCADLLKLPKYLSESTWVQDQLFGIHEGDVETDVDPNQGRSIHPSETSTVNTVSDTAVTATSSSSSSTAKSTIKVKIVYKDEIFAIKVPVPSTLEFLQNKVTSRLGFPVQLLYKKDGNQLTDLTTESFEAAVQLGKLTVVAS
ncbi:hypothetical protein RMCBS344292_03113 [Rhizopus microsporus]|nr:hypothetical protein RMCBS344292_03113 [Rhizopus microsporus]